MPRRYLSELPPPPALIASYDGPMPVDQVYAQWVTPFEPQENLEGPEPPLLEIYQSNLAELIDQDRNPCPEDDPAAASGQYQPALNHILALLEARGWTLVESDDDKDFNRFYLRQPEHNAWQPTRKLFNELSGYNRDTHRRIE